MKKAFGCAAEGQSRATRRGSRLEVAWAGIGLSSLESERLRSSALQFLEMLRVVSASCRPDVMVQTAPLAIARIGCSSNGTPGPMLGARVIVLMY